MSIWKHKGWKPVLSVSLSAMMAVCMMPLAGGFVSAASTDQDDAIEAARPVLEEIGKQMQDPSNDPFAFENGSSKKKILGNDLGQSYPSSYDLRDVNGKSYVTPVRFQNPFGSCWGFAAIAAAESSILGSGLAAQDNYDADTLDLSEKHLINFYARAIDNPDDPQNGEGMHYDEDYTLADKFNMGGLPFFATSIFASGVGPNLEDRSEPELDVASDIYEYHGADKSVETRKIDGKWQKFCYSEDDDWSIPEGMRFRQSYVLKESYLLPSSAGRDGSGKYVYNPDGTTAIKQQLMDKRAVEIGFHADTSQPNQEGDAKYLSRNWAHYTYNQLSANHAVTIVGWDDNYSRENFVDGHEPPEDGAWLVKNSWGSGEEEFPNRGNGNWGIENEEGVHTGYFWLSYYDQSIMLAEALDFDKSNVNTEYLLDEHDFMPVSDVNSALLADELLMSNVFEAAVYERLEQISCQTTVPGSKVNYTIYLLNDGFTSPTDGIKATSGSASFEYGGFHKIQLNEPVNILKGQSYSIVISQKTPQGYYTINVPATGGNKTYSDESGAGAWMEGVINPGESFLGLDEGNGAEWIDYSNEEVRKIFMDEEYKYYAMDNFPIKGYSKELGNLKMVFNSGSELELDMTEENSEAAVRTVFRGDADLFPENTDLQWSASAGSEDIFTIAPRADNSSYCDITALQPGEGYVYVTADGVGTQSLKVTVSGPPASAVTSLKSGKKKLTVSLKKVSADEISGYEISYRQKGKSSWKSKTLTPQTTKTTIKKLKKGKSYYVKVRTSIEKDGNTYNSAWSPAKLSKKIK